MKNLICSLLCVSASILNTLATSIPNSCSELEDGVYNLKFLEGDNYPVISTKCSNEYAILDYQQDNKIKDYFVSWAQWHYNTVGPSNEDDSKSLTWKQWFIPGQYDESMKYIISPDCNTCEETNQRQLYETETTYWMTGTIFGCFWAIKGQHNCDVDWDTDDCYTCAGGNFITTAGSTRVATDDSTTVYEYSKTGICPHSVQEASRYVPLTHDSCSHEEDEGSTTKLHFKPSLGIEGKYCVCVKPSTPSQFIVSDDSITGNSNDELTETEQLTSSTNTIELYQSNFEFGTYRITKPGTYTIMEDITFNFNPEYNTPNANRAWMPTTDQQTDYPGANDYRDPYFMGFFAGITIESDDVVLDLNGHTLQMSEHFYYQQRWFTTIELSTQYFLPGQGIGNFGGSPSVASNVVIKNGVLGLTSHHGIHGNYNNDIVIQDVKVQYFETHGIQFNGFDNIILRNVEVGPTSDKVFFNGEYGHARFLLPRYQKIADESEGQTIQFYGRSEPTTMKEIAENLEKCLDYAFNYVVNGVELTQDDEDYELFEEAKRLFVNEEGITNGGAQYGIFLNTFGASVFTYNLFTGYWSTKAVLENVKVYGMRHKMDEYVRLHIYQSGDIVINPFNAPLDVEEMFDDATSSNPTYKGNVILDAAIASNKFSDNWGYLQLQIVLNDFVVPWATGEDLTSITQDPIQIGCNSDVMIHSGKGINGIRLDGVAQITMKNVEIYDLYDSTPVGKDTCGEYESFCVQCGTSGGHFRQTLPMQIGFSGNMNQAINVNAAEKIVMENVYIDNIQSETGPAFGISIWPACSVQFKGEVSVTNVAAGILLEEGTYSYDDLPNKAPEACAVRVYYNYEDIYSTEVTESEDVEYSLSCISGHVGCFGEDSYSILGSVDGDETSCTTTATKIKRRPISKMFQSVIYVLSKQSNFHVIMEGLIIMGLAFAFCYFYSIKSNKNSSTQGYVLLKTEASNYGSI